VHYPSISLVIPCFNEQERIPHLLEGIHDFIVEWHGDFEFILVNDASTDNTIKVLSEQSLFQNLLLDKKIKVFHNSNKGKGGALQLGVAEATKEYVLTCDADMATSPLEIILWSKENESTFDGRTISIGSRTHPKSELVLITHRRAHGNLFNNVVRILTGLKQQDTQCGFKLYPTPIAKQLFATIKTMGWAHDVEILRNATKKGIGIIEMPITWNERDASKINLYRDGLKMIWEVMSMVVMNRKG
jgi:dolichyl-phosphate beta-glucosyltransferase